VVPPVSRRCSTRRRAGFTLVEVILAIMIVALISGVVATQVISRLDDGGAAALSRNLDAVTDAVQSFRRDVRRYPSSLAQLSAPPSAGAADLCGRPIPSRFRDGWRGPYLERSVGSGGLSSGGGVVRNTLTRDPAGGGYGQLYIDADDVERAVAEKLETAFDGDGNPTAGTVHWSEVGGTGRGTLRFGIPVSGC
jgi:general secretion pathway protein G